MISFGAFTFYQRRSQFNALGCLTIILESAHQQIDGRLSHQFSLNIDRANLWIHIFGQRRVIEPKQLDPLWHSNISLL